jgi:hypothetical protein
MMKQEVIGTIEGSKALAIKMSTKVRPKRDVSGITIKPVEMQTSTEKRPYMRPKGADPTVVCHKTNVTKQEVIDAFVCAVSETGKVIWRTSDLIELLQTYGSAYGDVPREAMKMLKKAHLIYMNKPDGIHYKFTVNMKNPFWGLV